MNTLPSFELALEQGADGIELDVRLTRDGELVIMHDNSVDATTNSSGHVADLTLAELQALDAGAWFNEAFCGTHVPTLDEVFEAVGQRTRINVEIKAESARGNGIEMKVAEVIRRHSLERSVIISSFNPITLRRFRQHVPQVPIGYLYAEDTPHFIPTLMIGLRHEARNPHHSLIDAAYMAWARQQAIASTRGQSMIRRARLNCATWVWTVSSPTNQTQFSRHCALDHAAVVGNDPAWFSPAL